jgi:hypothetical protein
VQFPKHIIKFSYIEKSLLFQHFPTPYLKKNFPIVFSRSKHLYQWFIFCHAMSLNAMAGYHESLLNATVRLKEDSCIDEMKELALEGGDASYTNFGEEVVDWSRKVRGGAVNQSAAQNADTGFQSTAKYKV